MRKIEYYIKEFKKYGYNEKENISDFWFLRKSEIAKYFFPISGTEDNFSLKIRWYSELGKKCREEIKSYINKKQDEKLQSRIKSDIFTTIDFSDFTFLHNSVKYNLKTFAQSFSTSHMTGISDLRGINLDGIRMNLCTIKRCMFAEASFKNANIQQCKFIHSNFVKADFTDSRFVAIIIDKYSKIGNSNFNGAFINAVKLEDEAIGYNGLHFKKVSYLTLIKDALCKLLKPSKSIDIENRKETVFWGVGTSKIQNNRLIKFRKYIEWYQNIYETIGDYKKIPFIKRFVFLLNILFTKHWSSLIVLSINAVIINFIFGLVIFWQNSNFFSGTFESVSLIDSIYVSIVTFSTMGSGYLIPINWIGQSIIILNVISGYVVLGLFIFLLTNKINFKY